MLSETILAAESYHYPTELLVLMIDTIPLVCRAKTDMIQFFQAAGVPPHILSPWSLKIRTDREGVKKNEIARAVLNELNRIETNQYLRARREVLKRVVEWADFATCWLADRERAELLVRRIRDLVGQRDALTSLNRERSADLEKVRHERKAQLEDLSRRRAARQAAKAKVFSVFGESDPWRRGHLLEAALNDLFKAHEISIRESFVLRTEKGQIREQIDGAIEIQSHLYLVEVRYRDSATGAEEIARHLSRVQYRSGARGLFISVSAFTEPAAISFREAHQDRVHLALPFQELVSLLEEDQLLSAYLHRRAQTAILEKDPFASQREPLQLAITP